MSTLNEIITFEHESEHVFEYDLEHNLSSKKYFSAPKIYNANGNINKRWYVYFSFRNPETGKLQRMKNIYGKANLYKTKEDRLSVLTMYRRRLLKLLREGYNPFEDNTERFTTNYAVQNNTAAISEPKIVSAPSNLPSPETTPSQVLETEPPIEDTRMSIKEAFDFSLEIKKKIVGERTLKDYEGRSNTFMTWVNDKQPEITSIEQVNKKVVISFLNAMLGKSSSRNFNNYRTDLGSLMQTMEDNDFIIANPVKKIKALKTVPQRNKTYTKEKQEEIFNYLEVKDPILLLYIKFISFNLLRPIEACRLKIKDINLAESTIQFKAKNSPLKTKRIPEILLKELPDLSQMDGDYFLFTPHKIGDAWEATENNRRDYFSKRYKKVVKDHFELGKNYGLYSFRHTFITKLYRAIAKDSSPFAAKSKLMQITGHATMDALEKYLRDIDAELPEDYSHLLK